MKILVTAPLHHIIKQKKQLQKKYDCTFLSHNDHQNINKLLKHNQGWICIPSSAKIIYKKNYPNIENLNFIATPSTGTNHISNEIKNNKNIDILSISLSKKVNLIKASSEYTFALALNLIKKILIADKYVKKGFWRNIEDKLRSDELFEKKVGIIGFGRIGKNIKKNSNVFGMHPTVYDPNVKKNNYNSIKNLKKLKINVI